MSEWRDVTVSDLAAETPNALVTGPFGSSIGSRFFQDSGVPVIRGSNLSENIERRLIHDGLVFVSEEKAKEFRRSIARKGDLVFTCWGTIGQVGLIDGRCPYSEYVISNKQMKLTPHPARADSLFLYYLFSGAEVSEQIKGQTIGSSVPGFNLGQLRSIRLRIPPLSEQRAIAAVLGALDDKIELNRRMNETLEALAQALFQNWFVDATQPGLPKGWCESTVDEEFNLTMGQSPPGESYNETGDGVPFYQGRTDFGFRYPMARVFCTVPTRFANAGDTLVSVRAPVGSVNMAAEKCSVGRGVAAVRHKSGSRSYTYYFMRSLESDFAKFEADGTVFGSINKADFHAIKRAAPPPEIVEAFEELLFPIDQRIENNENESRTLATLRDALLPKLLSGELRVPAKTVGLNL